MGTAHHVARLKVRADSASIYSCGPGPHFGMDLEAMRFSTVVPGCSRKRLATDGSLVDHRDPSWRMPVARSRSIPTRAKRSSAGTA